MISRKAKRKKRKITYALSLTGFFLLFIFVYFVVKFDVFKRKLFVSPIPYSQITKAVGSSFLGEVKQTLSKEGISFISVEISSQSAILIKTSEGDIFFSQEKSLGLQTSSLQRVLSRFTIEGKKFQILDFRFDRPIVKFK